MSARLSGGAAGSEPVDDLGQDVDDLERLKSNLRVREPQRRQTGDGMRLVAPAASGLLRGGAVVAKAVGLDEEAEIRPMEIDAEPIHESSRFRLGKLR